MDLVEIKELESGWIQRCLKNTLTTVLFDPKIITLVLVCGLLYLYLGNISLLLIIVFSFSMAYSIVSKIKTSQNQLLSKHFWQSFGIFLKTNKQLRFFIIITAFLISVDLYYTLTNEIGTANPNQIPTNGTETTDSSSSITMELTLVFLSLVLLPYFLFEIILKCGFNFYIPLKTDIFFKPENNQFEEEFTKFYYGKLLPELRSKNDYKKIVIPCYIISLISIIGIIVSASIFSDSSGILTHIIMAAILILYISFITHLVSELIDGKGEKVKQTEFKPATNEV